MTTSDAGRDPVDPDFAGLFRPLEEHPESAPEPDPRASSEPDPGPAPSTASEAPEVPAAPAVADVKAAPPPGTGGPDTGRLFRSQGASDHPEAVLALASDHFGRLRTLRRDDTPVPTDPPVPAEAPVPAVAAEPALQVGSAADPASISDLAPAPAVIPVIAYEPPQPAPDPALEVPTPTRSGSHRRRTITAAAGYLIVIGLTLVVGVANALLGGGTLGWPTGLALLVSSVYVAWSIRLDDAAVAVIVPPLAYALTAATAGQAFLGASANSLLNRAVAWFFQLAGAWPWIIGSTVAALAIVLVRRYRRPSR